MSLELSLGMLAWLLAEGEEEGAADLRADFTRINQVLRRHGYPEHHEPETQAALGDPASRAGVANCHYSDLHTLRRLYARLQADPHWLPTPQPNPEDPQDEAVMEAEYERAASHLMCHSDCDGYYVPIDFPEPILGEEDEVPGRGMLGSSQALLRELVFLAPHLGIRLEDGALRDAEAARLNALVEEEAPFAVELMVWLQLYEAARLSVAHRTILCFG